QLHSKVARSSYRLSNPSSSPHRQASSQSTTTARGSKSSCKTDIRFTSSKQTCILAASAVFGGADALPRGMLTAKFVMVLEALLFKFLCCRVDGGAIALGPVTGNNDSVAPKGQPFLFISANLLRILATPRPKPPDRLESR